MTDEWIESYLNAGKAVIAAKKLAGNLIKPGASFWKLLIDAKMKL